MSEEYYQRLVKDLNLRIDKLEFERNMKQQEIDRLSRVVTDYDELLMQKNNIIDELEKWLNEKWNKPLAQVYIADVVEEINKLKELKRGDNNDSKRDV